VQKYLTEHRESIRVLVNNAGIGKRGYSESISPADASGIVTVNCSAPVQLSNAAMASFVQNGKGTLINIGSSAGYQPLPYMAAYAASKAFIIRFTQALQGELAARGIPSSPVEVILASPSGTATNFQKSAGVKDDDAAKLLRPDQVAAAVVNRIGKGSCSIIIGTSGKGMALAARFMPSGIQIKLWESLMRSMR
jgi:short-subunit dehydrogenase